VGSGMAIYKSAGIPVILTSSLESESQGLYSEKNSSNMQHVFNTGVINAWDDQSL
jgi:hypothetical protein